MNRVISKNRHAFDLPHLPGVYIFKNQANAIIYVGKAKSLAKRVASYFHDKDHDWKVTALIEEYRTVEHIVTKNETEALLLEAQLIRDNKPKYNVLLKSGNPFLYIVLTSRELPELQLVRVKKTKGRYFGPFLRKYDARRAFNYLIKAFSLYLCNKSIDQGCLEYHLKKCAGSCKKDFDKEAYLVRLKLAIKALEGNYDNLLIDLKDQVSYYAQQHEFEKAQHIYQAITHFDTLVDTLKTGFSEAKYDPEVVYAMAQERPKQYATSNAAEDLQRTLNLPHAPQIIDCFDISHFQSRALVGACVRFINGIPAKNKFRRFKIKTLLEQNDYAALQEIVGRRYRTKEDLPDLVVIDGGKGQLSAVTERIGFLTCIALAKKEEMVFTPSLKEGVKLNVHTDAGKLLIALRDYTHHFAVRYHQKLRSKNSI